MDSNKYKGPPFTRLPHSIIEAMALTKLSGSEIRILLVIVRKTYGWGGEWDIIPYSQFEQMTMLTKDSIAKSFRRLVSKNVVELKNPTQKAWSPLRINPNFTDWIGYNFPQPTLSAKQRIKNINEDIQKQTMLPSKTDTVNDDEDDNNTSSKSNPHTGLYDEKHTKMYAERSTSIDKLKKGEKEMHSEREKTGNSPEKANEDEKQQSFLPPRDKEIVNRLVEAWNKIATGRIPKIKIIPQGSVRFKKALGRMNNKRFRDDYSAVLKIIPESPFLRGDISDFKVTFDWILVEGNFIKIFEGNFIKKEKNSKNDDSKPDKGRYHTGSGLKEVD